MDWIIAGLGNPGKKYEITRHNAGFLALDKLSGLWGVDVKKLKFQSLYGDKNGVLLLKPQTFMNLSGQAVRAAADYYKIPPERVIIIYDDICLPLGKIRIRAKGSDGGHNGIKDILLALNTDSFPRIKIGVGDKAESSMLDWVLSEFSKAEQPVMNDAFARATAAAEAIISKGLPYAMNVFNGDA